MLGEIMARVITHPLFIKFAVNKLADKGKVYYSNTLNTLFKITVYDGNVVYSESEYGADCVDDFQTYKKNLELIYVGNI